MSTWDFGAEDLAVNNGNGERLSVGLYGFRYVPGRFTLLS